MRDFMKNLIEGSDSMLKGQTSIIDWFDPKNEKHMEAYAVLQEKGQWPRQFIPEGLTFPRKWKSTLTEKVNEGNPTPKETFDKLKPMGKTALLGYARRINYPELSDFHHMEAEQIIDELISYLHGDEGVAFLEDPQNFPIAESKVKEALPGEEDPMRKNPDPATDEAPEDEMLDNDMDDELMNDEPAEIDFEKLYLGRTEDKHFYLVANKSEEGAAEDLQVVDQEGEPVYSAEENGLDVTDIAGFIKSAIKDANILTIERNVVLQYLVPEEEARIEDEDLEDEDSEDMPDNMNDLETPDEEKDKKNSTVGKKSPFESKENKVKDKKFAVRAIEKKLGLDYVTQVKKNTKKAAAALKDKDPEAAADALDKVADDASDAAKALKKMKAVEEEELADADAKEKEELAEKDKVRKETKATRDARKNFHLSDEADKDKKCKCGKDKECKCESKVNEEDLQETACNEVAGKLKEDDEFNRLVQAQLADPENSDAKEAVSGYVQKVWGDTLNNDAQAVSNVVEKAMKEETEAEYRKHMGLDKDKTEHPLGGRRFRGKHKDKDPDVEMDGYQKYRKHMGLDKNKNESKITETNITDDKGNSFSIQVIDEGDSDVTLQINQREFHFKPDFAKLYGIDEAGRLTDEGVKSMALETIGHLDETEYAELIGSGKVKEKKVNEDWGGGYEGDYEELWNILDSRLGQAVADQMYDLETGEFENPNSNAVTMIKQELDRIGDYIPGKMEIGEAIEEYEDFLDNYDDRMADKYEDEDEDDEIVRSIDKNKREPDVEEGKVNEMTEEDRYIGPDGKTLVDDYNDSYKFEDLVRAGEVVKNTPHAVISPDASGAWIVLVPAGADTEDEVDTPEDEDKKFADRVASKYKEDMYKECKTISKAIEKALLKEGTELTIQGGLLNGRKATVQAIKEGNISVNVVDDAGAALNVNITGEANINIGPDGAISVTPTPTPTEMPEVPMEEPVSEEVPAEEELAGAPGDEEEAPEIPGGEEELEDEFESKNKKKSEEDEMNLKTDEKCDKDKKKVKEEVGLKEIPVGFDINGEEITKGDKVSVNGKVRKVLAVWNNGTVDIEMVGPGGPSSDTVDIKGQDIEKIEIAEGIGDQTSEGIGSPSWYVQVPKEFFEKYQEEITKNYLTSKDQYPGEKGSVAGRSDKYIYLMYWYKSQAKKFANFMNSQGESEPYMFADTHGRTKFQDVQSKTEEGIGDQTKEVFEVEFIRDGKPDSTRVMAYDKAAAQKMLEQKPSVEKVTGVKQISGVKEADDKDVLSDTPEDLTADEPENEMETGGDVGDSIEDSIKLPSTKGQFELYGEKEGAGLINTGWAFDSKEEAENWLYNFDLEVENQEMLDALFPEGGGGLVRDTKTGEWWADMGEDRLEDLDSDMSIYYEKSASRASQWNGSQKVANVKVGKDMWSDEDEEIEDGALESAKKLLGIDQIDEFKVEETIRVGDKVQVCDSQFKCVVEEATVHEIDEEKGFELTGNTVPEEQKWYHTEYFQIDKL